MIRGPIRSGSTMRTLSLCTLLLLAATAAAAQPEVTLTARQSGRELVLELGPVDLPSGGHDAIQQPPPLQAEVPADGFIQGFQVELVDASGAPVPRQVIHHVNVMQPDRRELFAPVMLRMLAVGQETEDVRLPWFFGVPLRQGTRLLVTAMYHNPTGTSYSGVRLRLRLAFRPRSEHPQATAVMPFYLDVVPHGGFHSWDLPPGRSERSWEGKPALGGRVVGLGAHLHRYGVLLRLEDVTEGRVVWEARPVVDSAGEITSLPTRQFPVDRPRLDARHTYRVTAVYDNPTGETIPDGAMGALGGALIPDDQRRWPAADPAHPEYVRDREFTLVGSREQPRSHHGGHQH